MKVNEFMESVSLLARNIDPGKQGNVIDKGTGTRWLECIGGSAHGSCYSVSDLGDILHVPVRNMPLTPADFQSCDLIPIRWDVYRVMNIGDRESSAPFLVHDSLSIEDAIQLLKHKRNCNEVEHG